MEGKASLIMKETFVFSSNKIASNEESTVIGLKVSTGSIMQSSLMMITLSKYISDKADKNRGACLQ